MRLTSVALFGLLLFPPWTLGADDVDYQKDVKPVLQERCYACHGSLAQKAKLRVDSGANLMKAGVLVPGKPDTSELLTRIATTTADDRMPPEGHPLKPEQIEKIRAWIAQGAKVPADDQPETDPRDHWAFRPVVRPEIAVAPGQNPIDAFLEMGLKKQGLQPVPPAEKRVLLRRVYLDLIGLPPTPEQIAAFLKDETPQSYEKVVEGLLASPQYGERWARHFLDIWRYSDWWGLGAELRNSQKHIWHWRDWAIENFNDDTGYDEMIRQMLAADELYPTDSSKLRATGYLARSYFLFNRTSWLDEVVEHTGKGFLGLTFNCAKCHDHKYDPIKQSDYYQFRAIFEPYQIRTDLLPGEPDVAKNGVPRAFDCNLDAKTPFHIRGDERNPDKDRVIIPGLPQFLAPQGLKVTPVKLPPAAYRPGARPEFKAFLKKPIEAKLAAAKMAHQNAIAAKDKVKDSDTAAIMTASIEIAQKSIAAAEAELASIDARSSAEATSTNEGARAAASAEAAFAVCTAELAVVQAQADLLRATEKTKAAAEQKVKAAQAALAKAKKIAEKPGENYNRIPGSVKSPESNVDKANKNGPFPDTSTGRRSALANWIVDRQNPLAARVAVNHIWLRHFGNPLTAKVFDIGRKGAAPTHPELLDWLAVEFMENKWSFKHLHKLLVTSNAYQRGSSSVSSHPNIKIDPENQYLWRMNTIRMQSQMVRDSLLHLAGDADLKLYGPTIPAAAQETSLRRSMYFFHSHNEHNKFLDVFDNANVLECYRRSESIVPQQALALANSRLAMNTAVKINDRIHAKIGDVDDEQFVSAAYEFLIGASPDKAESAACVETIKELRDSLTSLKGQDRIRRARLQVIVAILNHHDFITIR